jgi:outer membrane protein OmpA-like peptidoglycan-associated protein
MDGRILPGSNPSEAIMDRNGKGRVVRLAVSLALAMAFAVEARAQDEAGCRDHPMFTRMKDYHIRECTTKPFDKVELYTAEDKTIDVEGKTTEINYACDREEGVPSSLQIVRNYTNAMRSLGGGPVYEWDGGVTLKLAKDGREIWVGVDTANAGYYYSLKVVERGAMTQEVSASDMMAALQKDGFMALYINFDTGKATIRAESRSNVEQVAALLKQNAGLRLSIEGHTDNVGTPAANKLLSEQRAKAVLDAVVATGVPTGRLAAVGWGQERPVADNRSEEGRAKNRRVELVKK